MPRSALAHLLLLGLAAACGGAPASAPLAGPSAVASSARPLTMAPAAVAPAASPSPAPPVSPSLSRERVAELRVAVRWALAVVRKRQIARLRAYRVAGRFPQRKDVFGTRVTHRLTGRPLFVDEWGAPCAVGYLMQRAGWEAEVAAIAKATPGVHVEEVTSGPIVEWVLRSGLTQDEATLIQPDYHVYLAKLARENARDMWRLRAHFAAVEKQLIANTEVSLDIATFRLLPVMLAGGSLAELADRAPAAAPAPPGT